MKIIICTTAAFLLFASALFGQGAIEGTVKDEKGKPLANVTLTVVDRSGKAVGEAVADDGNGGITVTGGLTLAN